MPASTRPRVEEPGLPAVLPAAAAGPDEPDDGLSGARLILQEGLFWSVYEPVVSLQTGQVIGYEGLARFARPDGTPVSPATLFALLHGSPSLLLEAELAVKRHQVAHAPQGVELFVNLDPDSWAAAGETLDNPLLDLVAGAPGKLVVEVIENLDAADATVARGFVAALRARGLRIALDDVGAANSLLSFESLDEAEVLKFDRSMLRRLGRPRRRAIVQALARMARETGARTVLEGVETAADLQLAHELGVDLVQGWYFKELCVTAGRHP
ncbi:MAG TPA: EAL domain-containing protein [Anaeromyxobacteraceae bacterium]|nr:EAL domain-containing protein [Anaeromyxobacteraceae bacterium]